MNIKQQKREIHDALVDALNQCAAVLSHIEQQYEKACEASENETLEQYKKRRLIEDEIIELRLVKKGINNALNPLTV